MNRAFSAAGDACFEIPRRVVGHSTRLGQRASFGSAAGDKALDHFEDLDPGPLASSESVVSNVAIGSSRLLKILCHALHLISLQYVRSSSCVIAGWTEHASAMFHHRLGGGHWTNQQGRDSHLQTTQNLAKHSFHRMLAGERRTPQRVASGDVGSLSYGKGQAVVLKHCLGNQHWVKRDESWGHAKSGYAVVTGYGVVEGSLAK